MKYVLDASSLLRFTDNETGADRVSTLLARAAQSEVAVVLSAVNWGEIITVLCKRYDVAHMEFITRNLLSLPLSIQPVSTSDAEAAGKLRHQFKLPYVDAFAGALAAREKAILITADFDFKNVPATALKIEFLPPK